jgi:hypothetical protein
VPDRSLLPSSKDAGGELVPSEVTEASSFESSSWGTLDCFVALLRDVSADTLRLLGGEDVFPAPGGVNWERTVSSSSDAGECWYGGAGSSAGSGDGG